MTIKEIFDKATSENKSLTYAEFEALAKQSNAKYVDLAEGNYVGKQIDTTVETFEKASKIGMDIKKMTNEEFAEEESTDNG